MREGHRVGCHGACHDQPVCREDAGSSASHRSGTSCGDRGLARVRIPRSGQFLGARNDDDGCTVDALVLCGGVVVLVCSFAAWVMLSLAVVLGRWRYDRLHPRRPGPISRAPCPEARSAREPQASDGLGQVARSHSIHAPCKGSSSPGATPRSERARELGREDRRPLRSGRSATSATTGRSACCSSAARRGHGSRSRIAAELERLAPAPGARPRSAPPRLRIRRCGSGAPRCSGRTPISASATLIALTWDADPNVRAAGDRDARPRSRAGGRRRAASRGSTTASGSSASMRRAPQATSSEPRLRRRSPGSSPTSGGGCGRRRRTRCAGWAPRRAVAALDAGARDPFARNGAAEVLQDIGFVDFLALDNPRSPLLERIYAAGGERFRTLRRHASRTRSDEGVRAA